jgi:DNA-binding FrmR family transcriptional regulator
MQPSNKTKLINHLSRIEGQIRGLKNMVEAGKYCVDIITQSLAVTKSLEAFEEGLLANHLSEHVSHQFQHGQSQKAVRELIKIYNLKNR